MKRLSILLCAVFLVVLSYNSFSLTNFIYSGVAYSTVGQPLPSATVDVRITIQNTSGGYYQETHAAVSTNQFGVFAVQVGTGGSQLGSLAGITVTATTRIQAETNYNSEGWVLSSNAGISDVMSEDALSAATTGAASGDLLYFDGTNWVAKNAVIQNAGGGQPIDNMPPYLVVNFSIALAGVFPSRNISDPFIGTICMFGFNFPPRFWATCDGQLLPISQNTALFSLLGTIYGGNGQTTFALPDFRGRMPMHFGQGSGLTDRTQGEISGSETITITTNQMPTHTHTIVYQ